MTVWKFTISAFEQKCEYVDFRKVQVGIAAFDNHGSDRSCSTKDLWQILSC
jgi:hypothetical protein